MAVILFFHYFGGVEDSSGSQMSNPLHGTEGADEILIDDHCSSDYPDVSWRFSWF